MSSRGKKKKERRNRANNNQEGFLEPEYEYFRLFDNIPPAEMEKLFNELQSNSTLTLKDDLASLIDEINKHDSLHILCLISYYYNFAALKERISKIYGNLEQFHIELLQVILLCFKYNEVKFDKLNEDPSRVIDLLQIISHKYIYYKSPSAINTINKENKFREILLHGIKLYTFSVRNWAYPEETYKVLNEIFAPISSDIKKKTGIDIVCIINFFGMLIEDIVANANDQLLTNIKLLKIKDKKEFIQEYKKVYDVPLNEDELMELSRNFPSRKEFVNRLMFYSMYKICEIFQIDVDKYTSLFAKSDMLFENFINDLIINFGELNKERIIPEYFLTNPIWIRPFIKDTIGNIYYPNVGIFQHSNFQLIGNLLHIDSDKALSKKLSDRKSEYLQAKLEEVFSKAFPDAKIFANFKWSINKEQQFETDMLVLMDNVAIIVEAKSGKFGDSAKRGADGRVKNNIDDLILGPALQSKRLENYIKEKRVINIFQKKAQHTLNLSHITKIIRISVTLDLIPILADDPKRLVDSGYLDDPDLIPSSMSLPDLILIFDLLENSYDKLHYLIKREEIEKKGILLGDETDKITFYLETGFSINLNDMNAKVNIYGASERLDKYYLNKYFGQSYVKPKPKRSKLWTDILKKIEEKGFAGWTDGAYILLNVDYKAQISTETNLRRMKPIVNKKWGLPNLINSINIKTETLSQIEVVSFFLYRNMPNDERNNAIQNHVQRIISEDKATRVLVVGINASVNSYPYSCLQLYPKEVS